MPTDKIDIMATGGGVHTVIAMANKRILFNVMWGIISEASVANNGSILHQS